MTRDADGVAFRGDPGRHDVAAGQRERDLQSGCAARQILVAFPRGHVLPMLLDSTDQVPVAVAEALRDFNERLVVEWITRIDEKRNRRWPLVGGVEHAAYRVEVQSEHVVVVGL